MTQDEGMRIVQVSIGIRHALVLRANGTVLAWGDNIGGICQVPDGLTDVIRIVAGDYHSLAIRSDGTVVSWGGNGFVEFGEEEVAPNGVPKDLTEVIQVATGCEHSIALFIDGTVASWGDDWRYQPDLKNLNDIIQVDGGDEYTIILNRDRQVFIISHTPHHDYWNMPNELSDVVQIAAGIHHALALTYAGHVIAWGFNDNGQCDVPGGLSDVVKIAAGGNRSLALTYDGRVVAWGFNSALPANLTGVAQIAVGAQYGIALTHSGQIFMLGDHAIHYYQIPDDVIDVVHIATGDTHTLAVTRAGRVVAWGNNTHGQCDVPADLPPVVRVAVNATQSFALTSDNRVVAWGGDLPSPLHGLQDVVQISANGKSVIALLQDGRVETNSRTPENLTHAVQVTAGHEHYVAITSEGKVVVWDHNDEYEPSYARRYARRYGTLNLPTTIGDVVAVAAGWYNSHAVTKDGRVVTWGKWSENEIDNVSGRIIQIVAGSAHVLALRADGTVVAWGNNASGQCDVPVWLSNVVQIAASNSRSIAVLRSGSIVVWGENNIADIDRLVQIGTTQQLYYIHQTVAYAGSEAALHSTPRGLLKKYHTSVQRPAIAKLRYMLAHPIPLMDDDCLRIIWPQDLAFDPFTGELIGYVMPFVGATPLNDVCASWLAQLSPWPTEGTTVPHAWRFVLAVAHATATVLAHIHAHGYVVGNLNPHDILVSAYGMVAFVDCDAFQVGDGSIYGCTSRTELYSAPEVVWHGTQWSCSVHSDAFALAVIIFRLVCGNVHPFMGDAVNPLPAHVIDSTAYFLIQRWWPYDDTNAAICVPPAQHVVHYAQLPVAVRGLFGRAFTGEPHQRPTPVEWVQVLDVWLGEVK